jgi:hypothetical protein
MAQQSVKRVRKTSNYPCALEHAFKIWIRSAHSHTGQQPRLHQQAGQKAASDNALVLEFTLASVGASTEGLLHVSP